MEGKDYFEVMKVDEAETPPLLTVKFANGVVSVINIDDVYAMRKWENGKKVWVKQGRT